MSTAADNISLDKQMPKMPKMMETLRAIFLLN
jgi:hypothetical protein